jgi:hypothetical protein
VSGPFPSPRKGSRHLLSFFILLTPFILLMAYALEHPVLDRMNGMLSGDIARGQEFQGHCARPGLPASEV